MTEVAAMIATFLNAARICSCRIFSPSCLNGGYDNWFLGTTAGTGKRARKRLFLRGKKLGADKKKNRGHIVKCEVDYKLASKPEVNSFSPTSIRIYRKLMAQDDCSNAVLEYINAGGYVCQGSADPGGDSRVRSQA
jgi:hypothetical protein